jgi:hypothetical protein
MDVLHGGCAGLDVHKETVVACVRRVDPAGKVSKDVQTFATMTYDLLSLRIADPRLKEGTSYQEISDPGEAA